MCKKDVKNGKPVKQCKNLEILLKKSDFQVFVFLSCQGWMMNPLCRHVLGVFLATFAGNFKSSSEKWWKKKNSTGRLQLESHFFYSLQIRKIWNTIFLQFPFTHFLRLKIQNNYFEFPSLSLNPSVTNLSIYLSIHQSIYLSIYLSIYQSIYLSSYLSLYLSKSI